MSQLCLFFAHGPLWCRHQVLSGPDSSPTDIPKEHKVPMDILLQVAFARFGTKDSIAVSVLAVSARLHAFCRIVGSIMGNLHGHTVLPPSKISQNNPSIVLERLLTD